MFFNPLINGEILPRVLPNDHRVVAPIIGVSEEVATGATKEVKIDHPTKSARDLGFELWMTIPESSWIGTVGEVEELTESL